MKRKNFVKLTAMATAAVMAASPAMVFAANTESADGDTSAGSTINGSGELEDYISKDVFKVVLPTNTDANFTLDPQGLLQVADSSAYTLGAGAVYFANKQDDGSTTYSNTSDPIEVINKSSYDIDVDFSVKVTLPEGVTMVESAADLANATTPSVYLAMKETDDTDATALKLGDNKAEVKAVNGVPEDTTNTTKENATGYLITATGTAGNYTYKYELGDKFDMDTAPRASYTLTGECDTIADWSALKDKDVTTEIIWSAKKHTDSYLSGKTMSAVNNSVTLSLPDEVTLSQVKITHDDGTGDIVLTNQYTLNGATFSIPGTNIETWLGLAPAFNKLVLTFSDGKTETITFQ